MSKIVDRILKSASETINNKIMFIEEIEEITKKHFGVSDSKIERMYINPGLELPKYSAKIQLSISPMCSYITLDIYDIDGDEIMDNLYAYIRLYFDELFNHCKSLNAGAPPAIISYYNDIITAFIEKYQPRKAAIVNDAERQRRQVKCSIKKSDDANKSIK